MTNDERYKHLDEARHVLETWPMETTGARQTIIDDALDALRKVLILAEEARDLETNATATSFVDEFDCGCCGTEVRKGSDYWLAFEGESGRACCRGCLESTTFVPEG